MINGVRIEHGIFGPIGFGRAVLKRVDRKTGEIVTRLGPYAAKLGARPRKGVHDVELPAKFLCLLRKLYYKFIKFQFAGNGGGGDSMFRWAGGIPRLFTPKKRRYAFREILEFTYGHDVERGIHSIAVTHPLDQFCRRTGVSIVCNRIRRARGEIHGRAPYGKQRKWIYYE